MVTNARLSGAAALFVASVLGAGIASAGDGGGSWGPPPQKCSQVSGSEGCYGSDLGPNYMDDAGNGDVNLSPHRIRVGEKLTVTADDGRHSGWTHEAPGLKAVSACTIDDTTCKFKGVSPTGGWLTYNMGFELGSREQDYYGVLPGLVRTRIKGRIVDGRGHGMPAVRVAAKGPAKLAETTDFQGNYLIEVPKDKAGSYEVVPKSPDGVFDPRKRQLRVPKGKTRTANFRGLCSARSSSGRRAQGFRPKNGLYEQDDASPSFTSVYYNCSTQKLRVRQVLWAPLRRRFGEPKTTIVCDHCPFVSRERKLEGRTFEFVHRVDSVRFRIPGAPGHLTRRYDLDFHFNNGRFTSNDRLVLDVFVLARRTGDSTVYAFAEKGLTLSLAGADSDPFD